MEVFSFTIGSKDSRAKRSAWLVALLGLACASPLPPLPPNAIAFGVFGDGPYNRFEAAPFKRLLRDVEAADIQWLLHVGDMLGVPCSDELLAERLAALSSLRTAVIYTPGDNEWADCYRKDSGGFEPLDRLRHIRRTFFAQPRQSLGSRPIQLESQSDSPKWTEFVENARWRLGGFLFVTIHVVGSANGAFEYQGRTPARDEEVTRRTEAALHWLDAAFATAHRDSLRGVVITMHADPGFTTPNGVWPAYTKLVEALSSHADAFPGQVLLIHGDHHTFRVDQPLTRAGGDTVLSNVTRLETFGSPDIGWVRVVVDTVAGRIVAYEPRKMARWFLW